MLDAFPFHFQVTPAAAKALGSGVGRAARSAIRAILRSHRSLEVAHQQFTIDGVLIVFSSRIGAKGDIMVELDLGNPDLAHRVILEDDLRRSQTQSIAAQRSAIRRKGLSP